MRSIVLAVCLAVLGGTVESAEKLVYHSSGKTPNVPMLNVIGTNQVELGTIHDCAVTNVPFRVANTGKVAVAITRLIPLCSCITASASADQVPPGGEVVVNMTMDPRTIKGSFDRGMWVCGNDTDVPHVLLKLTGKAVPLFAGVPDKAIPMNLLELGRAYTNQFRLSSAEPGLSLGTPVVATNSSGLAVTAEIARRSGETVHYEVTVVMAATTVGRHLADVEVPVLGGLKVAPVLFRFRGAAGSKLAAFPQQIEMDLNAAAPVYRLILRGGRSSKLDPKALSWEPLPAGVKIVPLAGREDNELLVRVEVAPDSVESLYLSKDTALTLAYPGYEPLTVPFVTETAGVRGPERGGRMGRSRRFSHDADDRKVRGFRF